MDFSGSGKRSTWMAAGAWTLPCLLSITSAVVFQVDPLPNPNNPGQTQPSCWPALVYDKSAPWKYKAYSIYAVSTFFYIPLILITICYVSIIVTIWRRSKKMGGPQKVKKAKCAKKDVTYEGISKDNNSNQTKHRASSRGLIPRAKIKTIKMTICIVTAYICCFMPFSLFFTLEAFGVIDPTTPSGAVANAVIQNLPSLNSATNPFIYGIFSTNVCKELRRIPAINWLADKLPCCTAWRPIRFGRTTNHTNTHVTDFTTNNSDGYSSPRMRSVMNMSGKVVDGHSTEDSRNSTSHI